MNWRVTNKMDPLFYVALAAVLILIIIVFSFVKKGQPNENEAVENAGDARPAVAPRRGAAVVGGARRRGGAVRNRMIDRQDDSDEEDDQEQFDHVTLPSGKIGAKKMKKLQEKEERARQREAELEEREERKKRQEQLDEMRKKRDEKEAAEEALQEEEEKALKAQKEKEEHEEYLRLKEQFTVEEEGTDASQLLEDTESLLQQFINYIMDMKVVMLEDLAAHFKLRTQDVIDRIKELQEAERLSGVLDDRGKFIHITQQEYEAVAKFIKQRGRVSISDLAEHSNILINLQPDNQKIHTQLVTGQTATTT